MKASKYILSTGIWLCFIGIKLAAQHTASAALSQSEILIGDHVTLRLNLGLAPDDGLANIRTDSLTRIEKIEVLSQSGLDTIALKPKLLLEQRFTLTAFDSGAYRIPPLLIITRKGDTLFTNALDLRVKTIPVTEEAELQPIKDIIREGYNWRDVAPYVLAVLLAGGLIFWLDRYSRKPLPALPPLPKPTRSPYDRARDRLAALERQPHGDYHSLKAYYSELNYLFREYLEHQFLLPALESTSREIEKTLSSRPAWAAWHEPLSDWLRRADLVKFAKASPQTSAVADFALVSDFIDFAQALADAEEAELSVQPQDTERQEGASAQPHSAETHSDDHE
jgi:hypothetical protein